MNPINEQTTPIDKRHFIKVLECNYVKPIVDSARERKVTVTAICGYSFVPRPTKDIATLEVCGECVALDAALRDLANEAGDDPS